MPEEPQDELGTTAGILNHAPLGIHVYQLTPDDQLVFAGANETANKMQQCLRFTLHPVLGLWIGRLLVATVGNWGC